MIFHQSPDLRLEEDDHAAPYHSTARAQQSVRLDVNKELSENRLKIDSDDKHKTGTSRSRAQARSDVMTIRATSQR